jgi:hypothetical protein
LITAWNMDYCTLQFHAKFQLTSFSLSYADNLTSCSLYLWRSQSFNLWNSLSVWLLC